MARLTINIPDNVALRVLAGMCGKFGYKDEINKDGAETVIPNPESKIGFVKRMLQEYILTSVIEFESKEQKRDIAKLVRDDVRSKIVFD